MEILKDNESEWAFLLREDDEFYNKAEDDLLRAALKRTYKERFLTMTSLMKDGLMMRKAKITLKKDPTEK